MTDPRFQLIQSTSPEGRNQFALSEVRKRISVQERSQKIYGLGPNTIGANEIAPGAVLQEITEAGGLSDAYLTSLAWAKLTGVPVFGTANLAANAATATGYAVGTTSDPAAPGSQAVVPEMQVTTSTAYDRLVWFEMEYSGGTGATANILIHDGTSNVGASVRTPYVPSAAVGVSFATSARIVAGQGTGVITAQWQLVAGTPKCVGVRRSLLVLEARR